jgi:hypothetical protein
LKGLAEKGPAMWDVHSRADEIQKIIRGDSAKVGDTPSLLSDLAAIRKQGREMDKQSTLGAEVERKPPPLSLVVEIQDGKAIAKRDAAQQRSPGFPIDAEQVNRLGLKHGDKVLAAFDASKQINIVQKVVNDNHHTQQQAHGLTRH